MQICDENTTGLIPETITVPSTNTFANERLKRQRQPNPSTNPSATTAVGDAPSGSPSPQSKALLSPSTGPFTADQRVGRRGRSLSRPLFPPQRQHRSYTQGAAIAPPSARTGSNVATSRVPQTTTRTRVFSRSRGPTVPSPVVAHPRVDSFTKNDYIFPSPLTSPPVISLTSDKDTPPSIDNPSLLSPANPAVVLSPQQQPSGFLSSSTAGVLRVKSLVRRVAPLIDNTASTPNTFPLGNHNSNPSNGTSNEHTAAAPLLNATTTTTTAFSTSPQGPERSPETAHLSNMGNRISSRRATPARAASRPRATGAGNETDSGFVTPRRFSTAQGSTGASPNAAAPTKPGSPSPQRREMDEKDADWVFHAPPNSQRTFFFPEENIEFSSEFDSGNLIQVERVGPCKYNLYTAMDCSNDERQANNRQWFHFSVRGGSKGATISVTVVGLMHCNMYSYEWMPVMAVLPNRPAYVRLPGKAATVPLDAVPPTPGYPMLVYRDPAERRRALEGIGESDEGAGGDAEDEAAGEDDDAGGDQSPRGDKEKGKKKKKKKPAAMNVMFDFRIDYDVPLTSAHPLGHPDCPAIYIASNHPYSYATLQTNLLSWQRQAAGRAGSRTNTPTNPTLDKAVGGKVWNFSPNFANGHQHNIYFHREVLCKTLEGRNVDLITLSDMYGIQGGPRDGETMPMLTFNGEATPVGFPYSSAHKQTSRPRRFAGKQYVVLTARVHAGECPGSHMMHGCLDFLMNAKDPRAIALRRHFVFFLVPMLNPDGVVRGHSRVDANGVDLNRMYRTPSYKRHPAAYGLWALLSSLAAEKRLALYIDMHAHANKRGTFFYANGMDAAPQVENLLYSKLVALNTPYLEFKSCNYSESNMSAVTRSGLSKDCSCRVVLYTETGVLHSYAVEASYVAGKSLNQMEPLAGIPGEEIETVASVRYSPATFNDTGKAMLLGLMDLKGLNPVSRVPLSPYQSTKAMALWLQRQLQIELAEKLFAIAYKEYGRVEPTDATQTLYSAILAKLTPEDIPEKVTLRGCRQLPPTTVGNFADFIPLELASTLLAQTPPTGPPRSLLAAGPARRKATPAAARTSPAAAASPVTDVPTAALVAAALSDGPAASRPQPVVAQAVTTGPGAGAAGMRRTASRNAPERAPQSDEIAEAVREASATR